MFQLSLAQRWKIILSRYKVWLILIESLSLRIWWKIETLFLIRPRLLNDNLKVIWRHQKLGTRHFKGQKWQSGEKDLTSFKNIMILLIKLLGLSLVPLKFSIWKIILMLSYWTYRINLSEKILFSILQMIILSRFRNRLKCCNPFLWWTLSQN